MDQSELPEQRPAQSRVGSAGNAAGRDLHGRGEGGQGVPDSAAGRLGRRLRRVQPVQVHGRHPAQSFGPSGDPAQPTPHGARRHASCANTSDGMDSIIANGTVTGPTTITISASDHAVEFSHAAVWTKRS